MDSEATRRKRLEDIEAKKKRLEEMRKSRAPSTSTVMDAIHSSPDRLLSHGGSSSEGTLISNMNKNNNYSAVDATNELVNSLLQNTSQSIEDDVINVEPKIVVAPVKSREELLHEKIQSFSIVKNISNTVSILPCIPVTYDKGIQTEGIDDEDDPSIDLLAITTQNKKIDGQQIPDKIDLPVAPVVTSSTTTPIRLTDAQRSNIITSNDFIFFLSKSSLLVERALSISESHTDLLKDFSIDDREDDHNQSNSIDKVLQIVSSSYDSDSTTGRPVMELKWSHLIPDLLLVAYGSSKASPSSSSSISSALSINSSSNRNSSSLNLGTDDIPGLLCVWSKDLHTRPEFKFIASSPILSAVFHTSEQHIIVGGCYSGQILLWDMRVQSGKSISTRELPVQRSSITGKGHKQPVYAMSMIASSAQVTSLTSSAQVMYELLSISTDGLLCRWDTSRLVEPLSYSFLFSDSVMGTSVRSSLMSFKSVDLTGQLNNIPTSTSIPPQFNICAMAVRSSVDVLSHETNNDALFGSGSGLLIRSAVPFKEGCPVTWKVV